MKTAFLVLLFTLVACTTPTIVQGPDGTPHHLISCLNLVDCYNEAARTCNGKYELVHTASQGGSGGPYWSNQASRVNILVKCQSTGPHTGAQ